MGKVTVEDNSEAWLQLTEHRFDVALGMMAQDVEMIAAFKVPTDTGALARYIRKYRISSKRWKVAVNKEYAAYQERGARADGSRRVVNYSRAGSGPHFLQDAIDVVSGRKLSYIKKALAFTGEFKGSGTNFG